MKEFKSIAVFAKQTLQESTKSARSTAFSCHAVAKIAAESYMQAAESVVRSYFGAITIDELTKQIGVAMYKAAANKCGVLFNDNLTPCVWLDNEEYTKAVAAGRCGEDLGQAAKEIERNTPIYKVQDKKVPILNKEGAPILSAKGEPMMRVEKVRVCVGYGKYTAMCKAYKKTAYNFNDAASAFILLACESEKMREQYEEAKKLAQAAATITKAPHKVTKKVPDENTANKAPRKSAKK